MPLKFIILLLSFGLTTCAVDGITVRVRQDIIDKLLVALHPKIISFALNMKMDDFHTPLMIGVTTDFSNIKVLDLKFVKPLGVTLDHGQLCIKSDEVTSKVSIQVFLKMLVGFNFVIEVDINIKNFLICNTIELDQQHKFVVKVARSSVAIDEINLVMKNTQGDTFNKISSMIGVMQNTIKNSINGFLETGLPKNIESAIAKQVEKNAPKFMINESKGLLMDLTPTHAPVLLDGITYSTKGYSFQEKEWAHNFDFVDPPAVLPEYEEGFGVTVYMNDFVVRNAIAVMYENTDLFSRTFTERSDIIPFDFTVEGFSKVFQKLDEKYPKDLKTKVSLKIVQVPNFKIRNDYISIFTTVEVDTFVIQNEKDVKFGAFSFVINVDTVASMEDIKILKIVPRASTIIDFDYFQLYGVTVDRELINQTVNGAVQLFINYFGFAHKTALDLIANQVTFLKTKLKLADNTLILACDVDIKEFPVLTPTGSPKDQKEKGQEKPIVPKSNGGAAIPEFRQETETNTDLPLINPRIGQKLLEMRQKIQKAKVEGQQQIV